MNNRSDWNKNINFAFMEQVLNRGGMVVGPSHAEGGVPFMLQDTGRHIEEEGMEINIPRELSESPKKYSFRGTNARVLDQILKLAGLSVTDKVTNVRSGDIVICVRSAWDQKKRAFTGTIKEILHEINTSGGCKPIIDPKSQIPNPKSQVTAKNGGTLPKGVKPRVKDWQAEDPNSPRWKKKKQRIEELSNGIHKLRLNVSRDIQSPDERTALTALIVAVMDRTAERIGNDDSADNGHFGVTGFRKKHISVVGSTVHLDYVGKSGTKHEKSFTDARLAKALKKAIKNAPGKFIFETSDGFRVKSDKVNRYLQQFNISAKDMRGYNANRWIIELLKKSDGKWQQADVEKQPKERKKIFNKAVKETAIRVGHGSGTLKKHYMIPELPIQYIQHGRIIDMKNLGYYLEGGELAKGIEVEKEHRNLFLKLKKRLAAQGVEMPITEQDFYKEIAKAHIKERKDYYDLLENYVEKYTNMKKGGNVETILWAVKKGDPDWAEQVITTKADRIEDAKIWASENGFHKFRISEIDLIEKPDFTKTFAEGGPLGKNFIKKLKKGDVVYYKGPSDADARKLTVTGKEEWADGEVEKIFVKDEDNYSFEINKYKFEYLFKNEPKIDGYSFDKKFSAFVGDTIGEYPGQSLGLIMMINNNKLSGEFNLTFTEEVKDGRSRRFDSNAPLKLKGREFSFGGINIKISDIKYNGTFEQPTESSHRYYDESYTITATINQLAEGGPTASIEEKIAERLQERQKTKEFKDTGIATYTRKYRAAYDIITYSDLVDIEKDNVTAYKLIEKSKIWPLYNVNELREQGNSSGAAYMKVKCREFLSSRPLDNKDARAVYVKNVEKLKAGLEPLKTVQDVTAYLKDFVDLDKFDFGDISSFKPSYYIESAYKGNLAKYNSRQVEEYFNDIFGKRFYNFCLIKSDPSKIIFSEAALYQAYTKEQRQREVERRYIAMQLRNKAYITLLEKVEAAPDEPQELAKALKDQNLYFGPLKKTEIIEYINKRLPFTTLSKEQIDKELSKAYTVREDDWSWFGAEKKEAAPKEDEEGKPRKPQNIFEKYGLDAPKIVKRTPLEFIKRTGGLQVGDVSTKAVLENYGFKNVIYGNYVNDVESKEHTRHILGAMLDLVELCNISIKDINKLGGLDINIGATGCGSFSSAMACYFPSLKAINLTKKRGDGSLGHEWAHYLDNVLAEGAEKRATNIQWATSVEKQPLKSTRVAMLLAEYKNWLMTGGTPRTEKVVFYPQKKFQFRIFGDTLPEAIAGIQSRYKAYADYKNSISNDLIRYYGFLAYKLNNNQPLEVELKTSATTFWTNSSRYIPVDYYTDPQELFARAFEGWLEYKLQTLGRSSTYLVDTSYALGMFSKLIPRKEWPYPFGEELVWLNDWFERLFSAIRVDYGIQPFTWGTTERVDEYTDYKPVANEKVAAGVAVSSDGTVTVTGPDTEEFEKGYGFRIDSLKDPKGENRNIYRLITNPYSRGKGFAVGGTQSDVFIFALKYFTDKKTGYGIADGMKGELPNIMKTAVDAKLEDAKREAIDYYKDYKEQKKSKPMQQESGQVEMFSKGGITGKTKSIGQLATEYINGWKMGMPQYLVEYNDGFSTIKDYPEAVLKAKKEGDASIIDIKTKRTEFFSAGQRMAEGGVAGMPEGKLTAEKVKQFFEGDLPSKIPAEKQKIDLSSASDTFDNLPFKSLNIKPIPYKVKPMDEPLKNLVGTDDLRPNMMGIYYDAEHKQKVATNAHVLAIIKDESITESKIVDPNNGKVIDARYPNYKAVIPENNPNKIPLTGNQVDNLLNELNGIARAKRFLNSRSESRIVARIAINGAEIFVNPVLLMIVIKALKQYGAPSIDIEFSTPNRGILIVDSRRNGNKGLVMPVMMKDDYIYVDVLQNAPAAAAPAPAPVAAPEQKPIERKATEKTDRKPTVSLHECAVRLGRKGGKASAKARAKMGEGGVISESDITAGARFKNRNGTIFIIDRVYKDPDFGTAVESSLEGGEKGNYRDSIEEVTAFLNEEDSVKLREGGPVEDTDPHDGSDVSEDSTEYLIDMELKPLIDKVRKRAFMPDYQAGVSDADVLGLIVSKYNRWDGDKIKETCVSAFEDANYRDAAEQVSKFAEGGSVEIDKLRKKAFMQDQLVKGYKQIIELVNVGAIKMQPHVKAGIENLLKQAEQVSKFAEGGSMQTIPDPIQHLIDDMIENKIYKKTVTIRDKEKLDKFMQDVKPAISQKALHVYVNPEKANELSIKLGADNVDKIKFHEGGSTKSCGCFSSYLKTKHPDISNRLMQEDVNSNPSLRSLVDKAYKAWQGGKLK